jgi:hypothetical protein
VWAAVEYKVSICIADVNIVKGKKERKAIENMRDKKRW